MKGSLPNLLMHCQVSNEIPHNITGMPRWISNPTEFEDPIDLNGKYIRTEDNKYPEYTMVTKKRTFVLVSK